MNKNTCYASDEELNEPINEALEPERSQIRKTPYSLPAGFVWDTLDLDDSAVVSSFYIKIFTNYIYSVFVYVLLDLKTV